ncbi:MAG: hypothetical protein ABSG46_15390, partial [Candidatus Binataceae bacterium]
QDRHEHGGLPELLDNFIGKDIVPLQFVVSPDPGCVAEPHVKERLKGGVKPADPAFLFGRERLVVDMGVAYKDIFRKAHHSHPPVLL